MKCTSCGAEIGLTTGKCPYCGRDIKENAGHRRDMAKYKKRSKKVKTNADEIVSSNKPIVISVIVMVLLLAAVIVALYVDDEAYTFRTQARYKESLKKYDEYSKKIQDYLDAGDYTGFLAFMEYHNIHEHEEPYKDLKFFVQTVDKYEEMVSSIEGFVMRGPNAEPYDSSYSLNYLASDIYYFYTQYETCDYSIENDPYKEYIYDMRDQADAMLELYFGIDDTKREEFLSYSINGMEAYLEEVVYGE